MEDLKKLFHSLDNRIVKLEKQMGFLIDHFNTLDNLVEKNRLDVKKIENNHKGE